ncbi:hypothetical protein BAR24066_07425 [Burkholderia arboris]|uniref:Uncharacterized protein n=1 Tax=Burkholderia arboris TaxID=488730 RepID=A0A9Q9UV48_9BURK|nr:hypothetical protein BAR24066_07425 [Burkholderia arboris]
MRLTDNGSCRMEQGARCARADGGPRISGGQAYRDACAAVMHDGQWPVFSWAHRRFSRRRMSAGIGFISTIFFSTSSGG